MPSLPTIIVAVLWLLLLGWGFHALLRRFLRLDDELADREVELATERHARSGVERALANTHLTLEKLARQQESVREAERQRIGRDIHDDLGQNLLALKIDLSLLHMSTKGAHPLITQKVHAMLGNLDLAIGSLRTVINDLRPIALEHGLAAAIEWQMAEFSRLSSIAHVLRCEPGTFDGWREPEREAAVFRILQEALANIVRHAHATEVTVVFERNAHVLGMTVQDNGVGMAPGGKASGCGLAGIRDRMVALGGTLRIDSQAGSGTVLTLIFPLSQPNAMQSA